MLQAGIKGKKEITVTLDKTAKAMGSGTMDVFATPAMIALMENTAFESVASELEEGSGTVGTALDIKHVSATPVGMKVTCESELMKVDGRALTFSVKAFGKYLFISSMVITFLFPFRIPGLYLVRGR